MALLLFLKHTSLHIEILVGKLFHIQQVKHYILIILQKKLKNLLFMKDIKLGIFTETGQPSTHLGFLHPKHLFASSIASSSPYPRETSLKFLPLSIGSCSLDLTLFFLNYSFFKSPLHPHPP